PYLGQQAATQRDGLLARHLLDHGRAFDNVFKRSAVGEQIEVLEHEAHVLAQLANKALLLTQWAAAVDLDVTHDDGAAGGFFQVIEAAQKGRLARSAGADDSDHFAGLHFQVDALENLVSLKFLGQFFNGDHASRLHVVAVGPCFQTVLNVREYRAQHPVDHRDGEIHGEDLKCSRGNQLRLAKHLRYLDGGGHCGVLDQRNEAVAQRWQGGACGLRQDRAAHGLRAGHADTRGRFPLSPVHGTNRCAQDLAGVGGHVQR
nr:hypothetical protein [Tanacetum cinerariifolium]